MNASHQWFRRAIVFVVPVWLLFTRGVIARLNRVAWSGPGAAPSQAGSTREPADEMLGVSNSAVSPKSARSFRATIAC